MVDLTIRFCHRLLSDTAEMGGCMLIRICTLNRTNMVHEQGKPRF